MKPAAVASAWRLLAGTSVFLALGYWLLWALAAPVTNSDSLNFNLARLWVIERGGLLHNTACTWDRLLTAPLAFDAVHYPFLYLGHAYELPSFLCFAGLLAGAYHLLRPRFGGSIGLLACLGLLGMPALVYQAVNTKNDLVVAFGLFVWFYALDRARRAVDNAGRLHLVMAALALGLIMGSKASGTAFGCLAGLATFAAFRGAHRREQAVVFGAALAVGVLLFGDWEIYLVNHHRFGHWLGEAADVDAHANVDGGRGVAANFLRYATDLSDPFFLTPSARAGFMHWKKDLVESWLRNLGLADAGMMHMPWRAIHEDNFTHVSAAVYNENNAGFGLPGMLVLWGTPLGLVWRRRWDLTARLWTVAVLAFVIILCTVGWSTANLRYLVAPFAFGWCGLAAWIGAANRGWLKAAVSLAAWVSMGLTVVFAVSKPWGQLTAVLRSPGALLTPQQTGVTRELDALAAARDFPVLLYCVPRTDIFDVYDRLRAEAVVVPELDAATFRSLEGRYHKGRYVVLAINRNVPVAPNLQALHPVAAKRRDKSDTGFFSWTAPGEK